MNVFDQIETMGLKISWKLLDIGVNGFGEFHAFLEYKDVTDYLCNHLDEKANPETIALICEQDNSERFKRLLSCMAALDPFECETQKRKWRAYFLQVELDTLDNDPLRGSLQLMDFWSSLEDSEGGPDIFPSKDPRYYFTESAYRTLVNANRIWLQNEINQIIECEKKLEKLQLRG